MSVKDIQEVHTVLQFDQKCANCSGKEKKNIRETKMIEFRSITLSLCLILVLKFTATKQSSSSVIERAEGEVTLPCENMNNNCLRINWLFSKSATTPATNLVKLGQINQTQASRARGDRLSVSAKCSLIIQRVTAADVGTYFCQQLNNLGQKEITTTAILSILNITEQRDGEEVTLKCSVISNDPCKHSIKWLLNGQNIDKNGKNLKTEQSNCFAKVTFQMSHAYEPGSYDLLKCEVAETGARGKQFIFRSQIPGRANGKSENNEAKQPSGVWWLYVIVAVGLAAFLLAGGLLIKRNKNKGKKTQVDENLDEPDGTILYATIFLAKTTSNKVWTDTTVIYSAINAEASLDPIDHYASVK